MKLCKFVYQSASNKNLFLVCSNSELGGTTLDFNRVLQKLQWVAKNTVFLTTQHKRKYIHIYVVVSGRKALCTSHLKFFYSLLNIFWRTLLLCSPWLCFGEHWGSRESKTYCISWSQSLSSYCNLSRSRLWYLRIFLLFYCV